MAGDVWQRRNFRLLWGGQFVSDLGGQLTAFALPCIAIVVLGASPFQVGALQSFEFAVVPLFALVMGVVVDRYPRRRLMLGANAVRLAALASLPVAFVLHGLSLAQFFIVGGIVSAASVLFDTAYAALLPAIVGRAGLARGISRLAGSASVAEALGASTAGAIVQFVGAPLALALNVGTYVVSTLNLLRIDVDDAPPQIAPDRTGARGSFVRDMRDGFALVARDRVLRSTALCSATSYLGGAVVMSVFALYCYRELHLAPATFGLVMGLANLGLLGALLARRIDARFGTPATLAGATVLAACGKFLFLLHAAPLAAVFLGRLCLSFSGPIADTTQQTLRAGRVTDAQLGRMTATMRTIVWGALPVGSLLGGTLATYAGIDATILGGSVVSLAAPLWLLAARERAGCAPQRQPLAA